MINIRRLDLARVGLPALPGIKALIPSK